jgi:hypothetical protein
MTLRIRMGPVSVSSRGRVGVRAGPVSWSGGGGRGRKPSKKSSDGQGCGALLVIVLGLAVIGLAIKYWYIAVPVLAIAGGATLWGRKLARDEVIKRAQIEAAAAQAKVLADDAARVRQQEDTLRLEAERRVRRDAQLAAWLVAPPPRLQAPGRFTENWFAEQVPLLHPGQIPMLEEALRNRGWKDDKIAHRLAPYLQENIWINPLPGRPPTTHAPDVLTVASAPAALPVLRISVGETYEFAVVGESNYQTSIAAAIGGWPRAHAIDRIRQEFDAHLVCEPTNQYDRNAVRVTSAEGATLAYFRRPDAARYAPVIASVTAGFALEVPAVVVARWIGSRWNGGVWLDLPTSENIMTAMRRHGAVVPLPDTPSATALLPSPTQWPPATPLRIPDGSRTSAPPAGRPSDLRCGRRSPGGGTVSGASGAS